MKTEKDRITSCDCNLIHKETVEYVAGKMPSEEDLYDLAELFKYLGDNIF